MNFKTVKMIMNKAVSKRKTVFGSRKKLFKMISPKIFSIGIVISLWVLMIVTIIFCHTENQIFDKMSYKLFTVYLHIGCLFAGCITTTILSYLMFFKNNYNSWFSTLGFLFYILAELIAAVNSLTMKHEPKLKFYLGSAIFFVLLTIFTHMVSWQYNIYMENRRKQREEYVLKLIESRIFNQGAIIRIPLSKPMGSTFPKKTWQSTPSSSTGRRY